MHGIKEINFQNEQALAQKIIAENPAKDIDRDYQIRQQALEAYLKDKYGTQQA